MSRTPAQDAAWLDGFTAGLRVSERDVEAPSVNERLDRVELLLLLMQGSLEAQIEVNESTGQWLRLLSGLEADAPAAVEDDWYIDGLTEREAHLASHFVNRLRTEPGEVGPVGR